MAKWLGELIKFGLRMLVALVAGLTERSCVGEQEQQHAQEMKKLASGFAPYTRARANGNKVVFKTHLVYFCTCYTTHDDFSQVKEFVDTDTDDGPWRESLRVLC